MKETVFLLDMFSDYAPPEELKEALSQAAIVAADINPEERSVHVAAHSPNYVPARLVDALVRDARILYGLSRLEITLTHPETELHKIEPMELMLLFEKINEMGTTVMVVTHEKELVNAFSKRVITIDGGNLISDGMDGYYSYEIE